MTTINIGNIDNPYFIQFDTIQDPISNSAYYLVKWNDDQEFIIARTAAAQLAITGVAPYAAREEEDRIVEAIAACDKLAA